MEIGVDLPSFTERYRPSMTGVVTNSTSVKGIGLDDLT